jgi:hypothetical protein
MGWKIFDLCHSIPDHIPKGLNQEFSESFGFRLNESLKILTFFKIISWV